MRTTKRFTPKIIARFVRQGRGQGTHDDYIPWHRVGRGDPSSRGRSHLQMFNERQRELLSDHEWVNLFFATMLPNLVDIREQFPLSTEDALHEISGYSALVNDQLYPGTLHLATQLGIKHPIITEGDESTEWIPSTDLLLAVRGMDGRIELLAISIKLAEEALQKRKKQLLALEREYWLIRGVTWLLITPDLYHKDVALNLRMQMPWTLGEKTSSCAQRTAVDIVQRFPGRSLTFVLDQLREVLGEMDLAQRAFWQAVYSGMLPMDLRRGWRPHQPIRLLKTTDFWELNPIASRRSAWI